MAKAPTIIDRWRQEDIGYFDSSNVEAFITKLKTAASIKGPKAVLQNVPIAFNPRDGSSSKKVFNWWHAELYEQQQNKIQKAPDLSRLCDALRARFGLTEIELLDKFSRARYGKREASANKDAQEFVGEVLFLAKQLYYTTEHALKMAWSKFDPELQMTLTPPNDVAGFL